VLAKGTSSDRRTNEELDNAFRDIVARAVASDEFLTELRGMPQQNLAVELLRKYGVRAIADVAGVAIGTVSAVRRGLGNPTRETPAAIARVVSVLVTAGQPETKELAADGRSAAEAPSTRRHECRRPAGTQTPARSGRRSRFPGVGMPPPGRDEVGRKPPADRPAAGRACPGDAVVPIAPDRRADAIVGR